MTDLGNDIWKSTIELNPGVYEYKFRNGLHDNWGGEPNGWESRKKLNSGGWLFLNENLHQLNTKIKLYQLVFEMKIFF